MSLRFLLEKLQQDAFTELRNFKNSEEAFERRGKLNALLELTDALNSILTENDTGQRRAVEYKSDTHGY